MNTEKRAPQYCGQTPFFGVFMYDEHKYKAGDCVERYVVNKEAPVPITVRVCERNHYAAVRIVSRADEKYDEEERDTRHAEKQSAGYNEHCALDGVFRIVERRIGFFAYARRNYAFENIVDRHAVKLGDLFKRENIGVAFRALPFGHRFV